jgi:hypothetical protein
MIELKRTKEAIMNEEFGQATATNDENAAESQSPSEKLEGKQPESSDVPGAENPDSKEVKEEVNPNTE